MVRRAEPRPCRGDNTSRNFPFGDTSNTGAEAFGILIAQVSCPNFQVFPNIVNLLGSGPRQDQGREKGLSLVTTMMLVAKAYRCAAVWHAQQRRKGEAAEPYVNHLAEVAELVSEATGGSDFNLIAAAVLHDAVEDAGITPDEIADEFNPDIASLVREVTDDKSLPKEERKRLQVEHAPQKTARAKILKIADKTSNLRGILNSPPADWSVDRKREYLEWARRVVAGARGQCESLERAFDEAAETLEAALLEQAPWTVHVDDNFHYMDEDERYLLGYFESYDSAEDACRKIVDRFLDRQTASTADELYRLYTSFGEDPWISGPKVDGRSFSAWGYARKRSQELLP